MGGKVETVKKWTQTGKYKDSFMADPKWHKHSRGDELEGGLSASTAA